MATAVDSTTVCGTWVRTIPGIPANKVNTVLPAAELWADTGFIQLNGVVGGTPMLDAMIHQPVCQIDFWAVRLDSEKPPWDRASRLAELVWIASQDPKYSVDVRMAIGGRSVRLLSCWPLTEPRKPPQGLDTGDPASYARYTMDVQFMWTVLP